MHPELKKLLFSEEIMENRTEKSEFIRLCIQLIMQCMVTALVGAADAIMTSTLDQKALSAVTLAGQPMQLFSFFTTAFCIGSTVLISQYYGINDMVSVEKVMNITLKSSLAGAFVFFAGALVIPKTIMSFFTNDGTLISLGTSYLRIVSPAILFMGFSQITMNLMKNTGAARKSAVVGIVTAVLNILLNYILIFGRFGLPALGVSGAAISTAISRFVELVLALILSRSGKVRFSPVGFFRPASGIRRKFWRYTLPSLLQLTSWKLASTCSIAIIGHQGSDLVAASSFIIILYSVLCSIADGYSNACGIKVGRELGRGDLQAARKSGDRMLAFSQVLAICTGIVTCLCCSLLLRFNSVMSDTAKSYLRIMIYFTAFRCIGKFFNTTLATGLFCAGGDIMYLLKLDIINMWLVMLPLGLLAAYVFHLPPIAVYFILNLDEFYKLYLMFRRYRRYCWLKNLTKKEWAPPGRFEDNVRSEIFRRMPLGVIVIAASGKITMANSASAELLGKDLSDLEGSSYIDLFLGDDGNEELADLVIEAVNDRTGTHEATVSCGRKDGEHLVHVKSSFLEDEDCRMGICLMLSEADRREA